MRYQLELKMTGGHMKYLLSIVAIILLPAVVFALDKVVSIEGPVRIVDRTATGATYYIETPEKIEYKLLVPPAESERFALMIKESPNPVVKLDGVVINNDGSQTLNVQNWKRVTRTTTTTDSLGNTSQEKTTTIEKD
jgi:hypothetical protein